MQKYSKALDQEGWSKHYNPRMLNEVINRIKNNDVEIWAEELIKICPPESNVLEIGCGTGVSSLWLAKNGRIVTSIDYTRESVELVKEASKALNINLKVVQCDARYDLPFEEKKFDYIFQAGLLEHFSDEEQIGLLKNWSRYTKNMISMVPNASSLPYRIGKAIMEENETWSWGLEIPKHSMAGEFSCAGIAVKKEYSIGTKWGLRFLPKNHYLNDIFERMHADGFNLDEFMQGYLVVTIGSCN